MLIFFCFLLSSVVIDDENPTLYTAGATVTVTVTLNRRNLGDVMVSDDAEETDMTGLNDEEEDEEKEDDDDKVRIKLI